MERIRHIFARLRRIPFPFVKRFALILLILALIYYPLGMIWAHKINDKTSYTAPLEMDIQGGSHTVAIAAGLIEREVEKHRWVPNDPAFQPSSALVRMPAFQRGIISSLSRFAVELSDQIGRSRGSSQIDPDLEKATGLLKYSPYVWMFDFGTSVLPTSPTEDQYRRAKSLLLSYNKRLAAGQAVFERRSDNLMEALDRIGTDMGASSAALDTHIRTKSRQFIDLDAAEEFYFIKGRMYADYLLLRELKRDFADMVKEKQLDSAWDNMLASLKEGAVLSHFIVLSGSPESAFFPNHMAMQGFYLLRARAQLREVTNILLK